MFPNLAEQKRGSRAETWGHLFFTEEERRRGRSRHVQQARGVGRLQRREELDALRRAGIWASFDFFQAWLLYRKERIERNSDFRLHEVCTNS